MVDKLHPSDFTRGHIRMLTGPPLAGLPYRRQHPHFAQENGLIVGSLWEPEPPRSVAWNTG